MIITRKKKIIIHRKLCKNTENEIIVTVIMNKYEIEWLWTDNGKRYNIISIRTIGL